MAIAVVEATCDAFFKKLRRLFSGMPELYLAGCERAARWCLKRQRSGYSDWSRPERFLGFTPLFPWASCPEVKSCGISRSNLLRTIAQANRSLRLSPPGTSFVPQGGWRSVRY